MKTDKCIGVIGAMDSEIEYLAGVLEERVTTRLYDYVFYSGALHGRRVTVVKCGIGKVNAARCTQLLIDRFEPCAILNTGIAGALREGLRVGDAVVASGLVQHDFDATAFGHARGYLFTGEDPDRPTVFRPDAGLVDALKEAAARALPGAAVTDGVVATGDLFVADPRTREAIRRGFDAAAAEMEGGAIAQTASYAGVPFAVLRIISDGADGEAAGSFEQFEKETARRSAAVIEGLIRRFDGHVSGISRGGR